MFFDFQYLDRIGQLFFGMPPPAQPQQQGLFGKLIFLLEFSMEAEQKLKCDLLWCPLIYGNSTKAKEKHIVFLCKNESEILLEAWCCLLRKNLFQLLRHPLICMAYTIDNWIQIAFLSLWKFLLSSCDLLYPNMPAT